MGEIWLVIGGGLILGGLILAWVAVLELIWHKANPKPRYRRKGANYVK